MDVNIIAAGIALVTVIIGFTLLYVQRVNLSRKLDALSIESEAHNQASYGMARHLKHLQSQNEKLAAAKKPVEHESQVQAQAYETNSSRTTADIVDFKSLREGNAETERADQESDGVLDLAVERLFSEGADARKLSEALGVSRSEAEIIAHIGPQHRNHA